MMHGQKTDKQLYMFRADTLPIIRNYLLYNRHWHILYSFDDLLPAESEWNIVSLQARVRQNCIKCVNVGCTVDNSWWWAGRLPETCRVVLPKIHLELRVCWFYSKGKQTGL